MPEIGQLLGGRYRLVGPLGEGGMASLFRAHDEQLDRDVAIKVLRPDYGRDPGFVARFRQEAQAAASLSHPNVVNVYDYGTGPAGPFIVMELVDGEDLESILQARAVLAPHAAARIALGVAEALAAAHAHGIVHRDVKPSNILVTTGGQVKVVDFGIARAWSDAELTLPGTTLGSVHYFSPEQARGEPVTAASDVYSLGLVLFEMLTGRRAFGGDSAASIAMARLAAPAPRPSSLRPDVPPALDAIAARALAPDPAARFASASAMADALRRYLGGDERPIAAPPAPPAGAPAAGVAGAAAAGLAAGVRTGPSHAAPPGIPPPPPMVDEGPDDEGRSSAWTWAAGILGLLILVAAAVLAFFALRGLGGPGPSPTGASVPVPRLIDLSLADARSAATAAGFKVEIGDTSSTSGKPPETVLGQDPPPDALAAPGTTILVTIATGSGTVGVPDVRGLSEPDAINALTDQGLKLGKLTEDFDPVIPEGSVIGTSPDTGTQVAPGSPVDLIVSKGPEPTPSPSPSPSPSPTPSPSPSPPPTEPPTPSPTEPPTPPPPTPSPTPPPPTPSPSPSPSPTGG